MESRIILSTADFSANNIGRYVELSDLTKKVLAKQTQYDRDSVEAIALNTFLTQLTSDGFIGGDSPLLTSLFIPALAKSHDELLYNIASLDESGYPVNGMSAEELSAETKGYSIYEKNGRIIAFCRKKEDDEPGVGTGDNRIKIDTKLFTEAGRFKSFSVVLYCLKGLDYQPANYFLSTCASNTSFYFGGEKVRARYGIQYDALYTETSGTYLGFSGISYVADTKFEGVADNITFGTSTVYDDTKLYNNDYQNMSKFAFCNTLYNGTWCVIPFFATANYINSEKMTQLRTYVNTLLTALHATEL